MSVLEQLATRQFLVVTGKGAWQDRRRGAPGPRAGVRGRRVLLLEVDPRANLHEIAGPCRRRRRLIAGPISSCRTQSQQVMAEVVRDQVKVEMLVRRVTASPVFRHFVDAAPG